ncbi:transglutaminase-like cysteine peptidase [Methylocapsa acidiphila]|uniref:transglutaminase-like cysteine peptidase n=1 Tax=Methylocapsa acidiphila TaxID=133552 RepID=UPI000418B2DA|nr:transglutaminase-like cysteine peptidase [Methylocapsa acidiphila]
MKDRPAKSKPIFFVEFRALTLALALFFLISSIVLPSDAEQVERAPPGAFALVGAPTSIPYGWADFCRRYDGECDGAPLPPRDVAFTPDAAEALERVNTWVNAHIEAVSDMEHWGVVDQWDYPSDGKGDCEDYALLKRKLLMKEGFPRQALLMTVVKDLNNEGHAILTVKTDAGEFVLDNLNNETKPWDQTGYRFIKRQSQTDQNVWVQLGEPTPEPDFVSRRAPPRVTYGRRRPSA